MLQSLLKIGKWQSEGKDKWDRFLDLPDLNRSDKRGNAITNYTLSIIFDLDNEKVTLTRDNLKEYDPEEFVSKFPLKIKGGNNKAIYATVPSGKLIQLYKTFFGKIGNPMKSGELKEAILRTNKSLLTEEFNKILDGIFELKDDFTEQTINDKGNIDFKIIRTRMELNRYENVVFVVAFIKAEKYGIAKPIPFTKLEEYTKFLEASYFENQTSEPKKEERRLCYASGNMLDDVTELNLESRYSLNKMFVTTTKNYAALFEEKNFRKNYQINLENQTLLDYASNYLLKKGYTVKIAGVDHVIIPEFMKHSEVNLEMALEGINKKSDLLFNLKILQNVSNEIDDWKGENEIYWLNLMAFESDGNFFKGIGVIKDVSNFHFNKILDAFYQTHRRFHRISFVDWTNIMTSYNFETKNKQYHYLNFNSLYKLIPIRRDKEKTNKALELFKTILENREVQKELIFEYFNELILCHYYGRYKSYPNVHDYSQNGNVKPTNYFVWACRDAVFKYQAFIQFLKVLKLIDMKEQVLQSDQVTENRWGKAIVDYFKEMTLSREQRAMFYLGRMLNTVEYMQQGKTMTVIQKVNFNGMDRDDIERLRIGLIEKAKQYNRIDKVIYTDQKFSDNFDYNKWQMNPNEAIFFLLTGYSFGVGVKKEEDSSDQ